ncbi:MAG: hypothetical protein HRU78_07870 [Gammaproteobacteria bacterium]|nr:MAG: hypothetical protein HRU78_07870 [Gammaproteobacteria bacterium]
MKYKVTRNIHHNNEKYTEGDEIELSLQEARPLLECKAIEQIIKPFSQASGMSSINSSK